MIYRMTADLVVVLHLLFILAVVLGGLLVLRWPKLAWAHIPVVLWGFTVEWTGWICPLTPLEQRLRLRAGQEGFEGGFIDHYLVPVIYPEGLTEATRITYAVLVAAINLSIYAYLWRRQRRRAARALARSR